MKKMILDFIKQFGNTNVTHAYIMLKTLGWIDDNVTYEDVDFAFTRLSVEKKIKKIDNVNYAII